jgi:hypothetical protein
MDSNPNKSTSKTIIAFLLLLIAALLCWHFLLIPLLGITIIASAAGWTVGIWAIVIFALCCIFALLLPIIGAIILGVLVALGAIVCIILFPFLFPLIIPIVLICICISFLKN